MREDPTNLEKVKPGDIVQIMQNDDRGFRGVLLIVSQVHSWGVQGYAIIPGSGSKPAPFSPPWSLIEPTGGRALLDHEGNAIRAPESKPRHHA